MKSFTILLLPLFLISCSHVDLETNRTIASQESEFKVFEGTYRVAHDQLPICKIGDIEVKTEEPSGLSIKYISSGMGAHYFNNINLGEIRNNDDAFSYSATKAVYKDGELKDFYKKCTGYTSICLNFRKFNLDISVKLSKKKLTIFGSSMVPPVYMQDKYGKAPIFIDSYQADNVVKCSFDLIK